MGFSDVFSPLERALLAYTDALVLQVEFDNRDDPIVEVAAPEDYKPANLGREIAYGLDESAERG